MITTLYNRVFGTHTAPFDGSGQYYLVVLDFLGKAPYKEQVYAAMRKYFNPAVYTVEEQELSLAEAADRVNLLRDVMNRLRFGQKVSACFALLCDGGQPDLFRRLKRITDAMLEGGLARGDRMMSVLVLPEEEERARVALGQMEAFPLESGIHQYALAQSRYREDRLADGICGALLQNCLKKQAEEADLGCLHAQKVVSGVLEELPEEGRARVQQHKSLAWHTVTAVFQDEKTDFLRYYMGKLLERVQDFGQFDLKHFCDEWFSQQIASSNNIALEEKLLHAIQMIPKVSDCKEGEGVNLHSYFSSCYQRDFFSGDKVVELTLKANLRGRKQFTESMVREAVGELFRQAGRYHTDQLIPQLCRKLEEYLKGLEALAEQRKKDWNDRAHAPSRQDRTIEIHQYVRSYLTYDCELRKQEFWRAVFSEILRNEGSFAEFSRKSKEMGAELLKLRGELYTVGDGGYRLEELPCYPAAALLCAQEESELCDRIRLAYLSQTEIMKERSEAKIKKAEPFCDLFQVAPRLYYDCEHRFTVDQSFSVVVSHRIGNYFIFNGV